MTQKTNSLKNKVSAWWLAIRPRTLPAAIAGVLTGTAVAVQDQLFRVWPFLGALAVALLLQIGSNLANDVFDFEKGADSGERLGPLRVTQSGLLTPQEVKLGTLIVFALAGMIGLALAAASSWWMLLVGGVAILSALAYTAGPYPLGYHGLGELFVFLFFGLASVVGSYFVQANHLTPLAWWVALPVGLIIVGILVVNNLRDIESDRQAGKNTLVARFGKKFAKAEYAVCLLMPYELMILFTLLGLTHWTALLTLLSLPLAAITLKMVFTLSGKPLNKALGITGMIAFYFSLLYLLSALLPF